MTAVRQIGIKMVVDSQSITTELPKSSREFQQFASTAESSAARTTRSLADVRMSVRDLVVAGAGITVVTKAIHELGSQIMALPKKGFDYSKDLEVSQTGMAGILGSMTAIHGAQTTYNEALVISSGMIGKLNDDALRTAATSKELVTVFQALLAPGLAARMDLDQIRQLTVVGTNAVKSMGLDATQVVQELRDLVAGGITPASSTLATALGLRDEDIAKARASSEGLFTFLMRRLQGFEQSSQAFGDTIKGKLDQISEGATRVAAAGMQPLTDASKSALDGVASLFLTIDEHKNVQLNPQLVGTLQSYSENLVTAGSAMKSVTETAWAHRDAIAAAATAYGAVRLGRTAAELVAVARANIEAAQTARVAAMAAAAQGEADAASAMTARQKAAALMAMLQAQRAEAQAEVQAAQAKIANLQATQQGIVAARAESIAKLQAAQSTITHAQAQLQASQAAIAQAQAQLSAAQAAGAQSYALAMAREATTALTAAQAGHTAATATLTAAQAAQAAATADLAMLGRQQAAVQASITTATAAQTAATTAATVATTRLSAAQAAASVAGRAMGTVMAALGGPVGIAIAAVSVLVMWLIKAKSAANDLAAQNQKIGRADTALAAGKPVDARDFMAYQQALNDLKDKRDELLRDGPATGGNPMSAKASKQRWSTELAETNASITKYEGQIAKIEALNSKAGSAAGLTVNPTTALQAFRKTVADAKTGGAAQQEYEDKKNSANLALEALKSSGAKPEVVAAAAKEYDEALVAWGKERDRKIKEINASGVSATTKSLDAQGEAIARGYKRQEAVTADGLDALDSLHRQGLLSDAAFLQQSAALRLADIESERKSLEERLALAKRKPDSAKEQETLRGQLNELEQKRINVANKADRDVSELYSQQSLALAQLAATTDEQAAAMERQNAMVGRTKSSVQALTVAELERQRVDLQGTDNVIPGYLDALDKRIAAEKRLVTALREQEGNELVSKSKEKEQDEARRTAESASSTFRDSFVRTFESGGNLASAIYKSFKTTVATAFADALYSATIKDSVESFALWMKATLSSALSAKTGGSMLGSLISAGASLFGGGWSSAGVQASGAVTSAVSGWGSVTATPLPALASAKGNAFGGNAGISAYRNTVIDRPTLFPFAKGVGLVGEAAGAPGEAIMPLTRTRDGRLGVASTGAGGAQSGMGSFVFAPQYNVDSRSDRAQVIADMRDVAQAQNKQLIEQFQRMKVLPQS